MYVDSGADLTLVPRNFGLLLGMNLHQNRQSLAGVTGVPLQVSLHTARLKIGTKIVSADIAVALRDKVPYLLGRAGVFKTHKISFEEYRGLTVFGNPSISKRNSQDSPRELLNVMRSRVAPKMDISKKKDFKGNVAEALLLNEKLRRKPSEDWDSAKVIRYWRNRRR